MMSYCKECDRTLNADEVEFVEVKEEMICEQCFEESYFTCEQCDNVFYYEDKSDSPNYELCHSCYEESCEVERENKAMTSSYYTRGNLL